MATPRKRKTKTVANDSYSKLDEHCIWLHEYYTSLRRAGFSTDTAYWLITNKESYPDWINGVTPEDIKRHLEEEDD